MLLKHLLENDEEELGSFIISQFEQGQLSYEQAWEKIKAEVPEGEWFFWEMELGSAKDLMDDDVIVHSQQHAAPPRLQ